MGSTGQDDATDAQIMQQLMQTLSDTNCTDEELIAAAGDLRFMTRSQGGMHQALELQILDTVLVPLLDRSADVAEQALEVIQNLSGPSDNTSISGTFCIPCLHHIYYAASYLTSQNKTECENWLPDEGGLQDMAISRRSLLSGRPRGRRL